MKKKQKKIIKLTRYLNNWLLNSKKKWCKNYRKYKKNNWKTKTL